MIVALSTSSPIAGVALLSESGEVLASRSMQANMAASGACLAMLEEMLTETGLAFDRATLFAADIGPGSFTGVKVGVTLAKTWAFALGVPACGADSFDLISPSITVVMPSKRGEFFVRRPGELAIRTTELPPAPYVGFGPGVEPAVYPSPERFGPLLPLLERISPEGLVARHLMEPSISQPKKPYVLGGGRD